jgi:DNA-binding transcriptional regulator YiaG
VTGLNKVFGEWVQKLTRREMKPFIRESRQRLAELRKVITELKKQIKANRIRPEPQPRPLRASTPLATISKSRLRVDGLKARRQKLGLSAKQYGKLLGVSALTVYNWEQGKSKPRRSQLPRIVAVRGMGKRQVAEWLSQQVDL